MVLRPAGRELVLPGRVRAVTVCFPVARSSSTMGEPTVPLAYGLVSMDVQMTQSACSER